MTAAAKWDALLRYSVAENSQQAAPVAVCEVYESSDPWGPDLPLLPAKPEPKRRAVRVPMPRLPALLLVPLVAGLLAGLLAGLAALAWWGL